MEIINLKTKTSDYDITIGENLLGSVLKHIKMPFDKAFIVTDQNVADLYLERLTENFKSKSVFCHIVKPGEKSKCLKTVSGIYDDFIENKISKSDLIIAFGGGVVGDITGFCAATILRGVNYIQIPTTMLSMLDSSIGGKCGVNAKQGKNLIGIIYQPKGVICDVALLKSLPKIELSGGVSEAIKCGFIKNPQILKFIEKQDLYNTIVECVKVKKEIVQEDEFENNIRMLLNFGHSFGHAVEKLGDYKKFSHGQAVAIGMVLAVKLGIKLKITKPEILQTLLNLLNKFELSTICPYTIEQMKEVIASDKKVRSGKINFIFIKDIGTAEIKPIGLNEISLEDKI